MRMWGFAVALVAGLLLGAKAEASIVVRVDKSTQTMRVVVDGEHRHTWAVSTGRIGYNTPNGSYRPQRLERQWRSRKYGMAPMPYSIFFRGGYAIHGTNMVGRLGRTDSHGCIRLSPANARTLFEMVGRRRGETRIVIEGASPRSTPPAMVARGGNARVAAAPPRTTQMRLVQPPAQARAVPAGAIRFAQPATQQQQRLAQPSGERRTAQLAPRGGRGDLPTYRAAPPTDGNRFFLDWLLRR
jgi:hypothetical protein